MDTLSYLLGKKAGGGSGGALEPIVVEELPQTGQSGKLYLVPRQTTETNNVFDEYIYVNNAWELIGTAEIDLSGKQDLITSTNKLDASLVDDSLSTNKFVTTQEKTIWNNKSDFSGSYNDLTNKPTLFSGDYTDLTNKPAIPDELSDLTDDSTHRLVTDTEKTTWNGKQDIMQYSTMPTATSEIVGKIVQYTGTTDSTYTNGYFYIGTSATENDVTTYSWSALNVQAGGNVDLESQGIFIKDMSSLGFDPTNTSTFNNINFFQPIINKIAERYNNQGETQGVLFGLQDKINRYRYIAFGIEVLGTTSIRFSSISYMRNPNNNSLGHQVLITFTINATTYEITRIQPSSIGEIPMTYCTEQWTPSSDYGAVHKKYVDDSISTAVGSINTVLATLTTPSGNGGN